MAITFDDQADRDRLEKILTYFILATEDRKMVFDAIDDGSQDVTKPIAIKVNRLKRAMALMLILRGSALTADEADILRDPSEDTEAGVIKTLHTICLRRYKDGGEFPDFMLLGAEYDTDEFKSDYRHFYRTFGAGI